MICMASVWPPCQGMAYHVFHFSTESHFYHPKVFTNFLVA
jgi:hypothetical protein